MKVGPLARHIHDNLCIIIQHGVKRLRNPANRGIVFEQALGDYLTDHSFLSLENVGWKTG